MCLPRKLFKLVREVQGKVSVIMETKVRSKKSMASKGIGKSLPIFEESCSFEGYDADTLTTIFGLNGIIPKMNSVYRIML